jgi:hypothetical protein
MEINRTGSGLCQVVDMDIGILNLRVLIQEFRFSFFFVSLFSGYVSTLVPLV